jgi:hypothetical protein
MDQRPHKSPCMLCIRGQEKSLYSEDQRPEKSIFYIIVAKKHLSGRRSAVEVVYGYFQCWKMASPARNFSPLGRGKKRKWCLPFNFRILVSVAERRKECAMHRIKNKYNGKQVSSLIILILKK